MPYNKNLHCIELCSKHIKKMRLVFEEFEIKSLGDFENSGTCQLAITQLITNLHEVSKRISAIKTERLPLLKKQEKRIKVARNVASHDYENINLDIIYKLATDLIRNEILAELEAAADEFGNHTTEH